jgi:mannose-6-phosphate isomerase-like protein (cupin superfamily)
MTRLRLTTTFALAALALTSCATASTARHHAATLGGPPSRGVEFPTAASAGGPREVRVLVDEPALKLASIVLRGGTVLPTHHAQVPVTIMALQGSGSVVIGTERLRLDPSHAVVLAPNVPHSVEPETGTDLVLLVHHLGRGEEHHP